MAYLGGLLATIGFLALIVAVVGLIRQRVRWTRIIATRRDAAFLLVGALVAMAVGGAISPAQVSTTPSAARADALAAAPSSAPALVAAPPSEPAPSISPSTAAPTPSASPSTTPVTTPSSAASAPAVIAAPAPALTVPSQRTYVAPPPAPAPTHTTTRVRQAPPATGSSTGRSSDYYTNVDGNQVHRPVAASSAPSGATAKCNDGTYSFSQHHQGTCSHHGGVAAFL